MRQPNVTPEKIKSHIYHLNNGKYAMRSQKGWYHSQTEKPTELEAYIESLKMVAENLQSQLSAILVELEKLEKV